MDRLISEINRIFQTYTSITSIMMQTKNLVKFFEHMLRKPTCDELQFRVDAK